MKKQFKKISVLLFLVIIFLCACSSKPEQRTVDTSVAIETTIPMETTAEPTEPEIEPEPEWLSESAIEEAYACLFSLEEEKNIELAQEILLPLVESGNAEAMYYWGYIYHTELAFTSEEKEGLYWYLLAAEQNFPKAYLGLIDCIEDNEKSKYVEAAKDAGLFELSAAELGADGCTLVGLYYESQKQYNTAMDWYLKASDMGSTKGMNQVGWLHEHGLGYKQDAMLALEWYLKAANLGDILCMNNYGLLLYDNALEIVKDQYASSLPEYQKAAEQGDPVAMYNIAHMYEEGLGGLPYNNSKAMEWYQKAADLGDGYAMYRIGVLYQYDISQNYKKAMEYYLKAAELGSSYAMSAISSMYRYGYGVDVDETAANNWSTQARNTEDKYIDNEQYIDYYDEVDKTKNTALEWLTRSAESDVYLAMHNIGYTYWDGKYWNRSYDETIRMSEQWHKKAADLGYNVAMQKLGNLYNNVEHYDESMEYYIKAYANGYSSDQSIRKLLSKKQGVNGFFENYGEFISPNS